MIRLTGFFAVVLAAILLAISYFVALLNTKTEKNDVKLLGKITIAFLWAGAAIALLVGAFIVMTGKHPAVMIAKEVFQNMPCCQGMVK